MNRWIMYLFLALCKFLVSLTFVFFFFFVACAFKVRPQKKEKKIRDHRDLPTHTVVRWFTLLQHQCPVCWWISVASSNKIHSTLYKCLFCGATLTLPLLTKPESFKWQNKILTFRRKKKQKNKKSFLIFNKCKAAKTAFNI